MNNFRFILLISVFIFGERVNAASLALASRTAIRQATRHQTSRSFSASTNKEKVKIPPFLTAAIVAGSCASIATSYVVFKHHPEASPIINKALPSFTIGQNKDIIELKNQGTLGAKIENFVIYTNIEEFLNEGVRPGILGQRINEKCRGGKTRWAVRNLKRGFNLAPGEREGILGFTPGKDLGGKRIDFPVSSWIFLRRVVISFDGSFFDQLLNRKRLYSVDPNITPETIFIAWKLGHEVLGDDQRALAMGKIEQAKAKQERIERLYSLTFETAFYYDHAVAPSAYEKMNSESVDTLVDCPIKFIMGKLRLAPQSFKGSSFSEVIKNAASGLKQRNMIKHAEYAEKFLTDLQARVAELSQMGDINDIIFSSLEENEFTLQQKRVEDLAEKWNNFRTELENSTDGNVEQHEAYGNKLLADIAEEINTIKATGFSVRRYLQENILNGEDMGRKLEFSKSFCNENLWYDLGKGEEDTDLHKEFRNSLEAAVNSKRAEWTRRK